MSRESSPSAPIVVHRSSREPNCQNQNDKPTSKNGTPVPLINRSNRPSRACTIRAAARLYATSQPVADRKPKTPKKEQRVCEGSTNQQQCGKIITQLVEPPEPSQLTRWKIRSMWELASILNFLHAFRPLLNISSEFSSEEFETALITPNDTLSDIHIPLLKAIPPVTRMALTRDTWITVLCRKLRDWWHWVADGELPIVASHGVEIETYNSLDPGVRVVILKALCDIRVEQEDIRIHIDKSLKHGIQLLAFRKERIGGDAQGISYWYEEDPICGHRLYREIRKTELKKAKMKGSNVLPSTAYMWETVATNFDEFQDVCEKLFESKNRSEASLGKKLKSDMLPEIEKVHKKKERLMKKQHREALLLDNYMGVDGLAAGRSLRGRKPVTYTFDDYDRSINEAIKVTKKQPSPELQPRREASVKLEALTNGRRSGSSQSPQHMDFHLSSESPYYDDDDDAEEEHTIQTLDRSNRRRKRPTRYSEKEFVEPISDNEIDFDSDDDIVGEAIYDEEYLKKHKQRRKSSSSSEGDEEYHWDEENAEEEEEDEDSLSISEESDEPRKVKESTGRTRRETKLRSVDDIQSGLRRSRRATNSRINYRQYEFSESETESRRPQTSNPSDEQSDATENGDFSTESHDSDVNEEEEEGKMNDQSTEKLDQSAEAYNSTAGREQTQPPEKRNEHHDPEEVEGFVKRRFLDLNELAPASGFDEGPNKMKDDFNNF